jgi:hypothetical protein
MGLGWPGEGAARIKVILSSSLLPPSSQETPLTLTLCWASLGPKDRVPLISLGLWAEETGSRTRTELGNTGIMGVQRRDLGFSDPPGGSAITCRVSKNPHGAIRSGFRTEMRLGLHLVPPTILQLQGRASYAEPRTPVQNEGVSGLSA